MRSRFLQPTAWLLAAVLPATACQRQAPPGILLITLDTTRADHLGCYGGGERVSPHLDRLAEEGVLFLDAVAQAAVTPVSHASLFTGQNPFSHGLRVMHGRAHNVLPPGATTLAELLRARGYATAAFVSAFPVTERFGFDQGFDHFDASFLEAGDGAVTEQGVVNTGRSQRGAGDTTDAALAWLQQRAAPFFCWMHYFDPHDTRVLPPAGFLNRHQPEGELSPEDTLRRLYDVEIQYMDQQIGRLLDTMRERGLLENTVVAVLADHGEGLGDHGWWSHGILYQEQVRVPLILWGAGLPAGTRVSRRARVIDVLPTLLDLAGLGEAAPPGVEGESLRPLWSGADGPERVAYSDSVNMLVYSAPTGGADRKDDMLFAVYDGPWKYIHHGLRPEESELYDLREDPGELTNLYARMPAEAARLHELLARSPYLPADAGGEPLSAEDQAHLQALGYGK